MWVFIAFLGVGCERESGTAVTREPSAANERSTAPADQPLRRETQAPTQQEEQPSNGSDAAAGPPEAQATDSSTAVTGGGVIDKLNPDLHEIFRLIRLRQTGPARVRLVNYMNLHPEDGQAAFLFGLTYHREKKYTQALPHFEKAIALAPHYPVTLYFQGWALLNTGELESARKTFEAFLQVKPDEPDAHFAMGLIELDEHNLNDAQRHLEKSIELLNARNPQPATVDTVNTQDAAALAKAHARLSEVFEQRADSGTDSESRQALEQAKAHLTTAITLNPDAYEAMYKLYRVYVRLGEHELAESMHKQYLAAKERVRPTPGEGAPE